PVPSKTYAGAPQQFDAWFAKACDRDPNRRFQTARELAEALARVVASVPEAMRGELPPRPLSIRPPPVAPQSTRGAAPQSTKRSSTKAGMGAAPSRPAPSSPAIPPPRPESAKAEPLEADDLEVLDDPDAPTRMRVP